MPAKEAATQAAAQTTSATAEVIDHVIDKASEGLAAISAALSEHGPQAWALAVHGVYARGVAQLLVAAICFGFFLLFTLISAFFGWQASKSKDEEIGIPLVICSLIAGSIAVILFIATCMNGLDSDAWAKLISPDGYLAQSMLTSITK